MGFAMGQMLIKNGTFITMDSKRRIIKDGNLLVSGNRIQEIGKSDEIESKYDLEKTIDAKGKVVLPGLVNTHTHLFQTLLKGLGADRTLIDWFRKMTAPAASHLTQKDVQIAALLGCLDAVKSGTTCIAEYNYINPTPGFSNSIIGALQDFGIRGIYIRSWTDAGQDLELPEGIIEKTEDAINDTERVMKEFNGAGNGMIHVWAGPCAIWQVTTESLLASRELADKYNTGISIHVSETPFFSEYSKRKYEMGDLDYYNSLGILGPDVLAVHCCWLTERDIRILKGNGVKVSHNPVSNMLLSDGIAPIPRMVESGITVGLGTDGAASNDNQDMMAVLKFAALLHKVGAVQDPTVITAEKILEMATIDGARCLGLESQIGSLEEGKKADIIIIDPKTPNVVPVHYLPSSLVYCATSENVNTVIVDGNVVMENRKILTVNETEILEQAQKAADSLVDRSGITECRERSWRAMAW